MSDLPLGYRPGWYTGDDLRTLKVPKAAVEAAEARRDLTPAAERRLWQVPDAVGLGANGDFRLPAGIEALLIFSFGSRDYTWIPDLSRPPGEGIGTVGFKAPDGTMVQGDVVLPTWEDGKTPLRMFPGTVCLFARLWCTGALNPRLTLRASGRERPYIALEGLEHARKIADAARLLNHVRLLERLSARGAPLAGDYEEIARAARKLKQEFKQAGRRATWQVVHETLGIDRAKLYRALDRYPEKKVLRSRPK